MVFKGATIGDNSIIAAGSVVTRAIPADAVAAGVPARVVRYLSARADSEQEAVAPPTDG